MSRKKESRSGRGLSGTATGGRKSPGTVLGDERRLCQYASKTNRNEPQKLKCLNTIPSEDRVLGRRNDKGNVNPGNGGTIPEKGAEGT